MDMATYIANGECEDCKKTRRSRCRVLKERSALCPADTNLPILATLTDTTSPEQQALFSKAPALYSFNVPKYFAILLRAREFAKQHSVQLSWCYAQDIPLHPGDRDLRTEALHAKMTSWLQRHDQDTCNLTSLLPLAVGLPLRLTDNVDRERQLYRGRRGFMHGWTLDPRCTSVETDGEFLLNHMPLVIVCALRIPPRLLEPSARFPA